MGPLHAAPNGAWSVPRARLLSINMSPLTGLDQGGGPASYKHVAPNGACLLGARPLIALAQGRHVFSNAAPDTPQTSSVRSGMFIAKTPQPSPSPVRGGMFIATVAQTSRKLR